MFIIVNIAAMPWCSAPISQPVAPSNSITQVGLPCRPILCSSDSARTPFATPGPAVGVGHELRHQEERDAPGARRAVRQPRQHQVADVLGDVVVAPGDEDLLPGDRVGAVAVRLGARAHRADVRARLRLGQVHRAGPVAGDELRQVDAPSDSSEAWCSSASIWPWVSSGQSDSAMLAPEHISLRQVSSVTGSPMPPCSGSAAMPDPAALGERPVGRGEAGRRPHHAVLEPRRLEVAGPAQRRQHVLGEPRRLAEDRLDRLRRRLGEALGLGQPPGAEHVVEQEAHLARRARDRSWYPPGLADCRFRPRGEPLSGPPAAGADSRPAVRAHKQDAASAMADRNTVTLSDSDRGLRAAAGLLRAGELVAFPTETVYGLGADARDRRARSPAIFAAKGRPALQPADRPRRRRSPPPSASPTFAAPAPRARRALLARAADAGAAAPAGAGARRAR